MTSTDPFERQRIADLEAKRLEEERKKMAENEKRNDNGDIHPLCSSKEFCHKDFGAAGSKI